MAERTTPEGELELLVKLEGYAADECTWKPESALRETAEELVDVWKSRNFGDKKVDNGGMDLEALVEEVYDVEEILEKKTVIRGERECYPAQ